MDKDSILSIAKYIAIMLIVYSCVWSMGKFFADSVKSYEVINPELGVKCIIVSRMFNTSVDCWSDRE